LHYSAVHCTNTVDLSPSAAIAWVEKITVTGAGGDLDAARREKDLRDLAANGEVHILRNSAGQGDDGEGSFTHYHSDHLPGLVEHGTATVAWLHRR
jgi:hypothetical protein